MKTVYTSNSKIAQLWVNQSQQTARCRNSHFIGSDFFSYSTRVGRIINGLVVLSSERYSNTTAKHINQAYKASNYQAVFVRFPDASAIVNRDFAAAEVGELLLKAKRARLHGELYKVQALKIAQDFNVYAEALGQRHLYFNLATLTR